MKNINRIFISADASIQEAIKVIDSGAVKIALVLDDDGQLIGTVSDGDIRKSILKKKNLSGLIETIYSKNPITAHGDCTKVELLNLCHKHRIEQIPIINEKNKVIDLYILNDFILPKNQNNKIFLMVGGLGKRLRPLTEDMPKPMLHVGGKPILQTIVEGFVKSGFTNITMCSGYKSHKIQDFFGNGSQFGAEIDYVIENQRMGTAGALTLINQGLDKPFFVMNGDLLTNVNFQNMLDFHEAQNSKATMCVREYDFKVPFGVVTTNNKKITLIEEKPVHSFFVNAGIYILEPECIDLIPDSEFYDMTSLFEKIISAGGNTIAFPLQEYWLDIGRKSEYEKANVDFNKVFNAS
jgi:dTDP-glucose pyrophosphorylase